MDAIDVEGGGGGGGGGLRAAVEVEVEVDMHGRPRRQAYLLRCGRDNGSSTTIRGAKSGISTTQDALIFHHIVLSYIVCLYPTLVFILRNEPQTISISSHSSTL